MPTPRRRVPYGAVAFVVTEEGEAQLIDMRPNDVNSSFQYKVMQALQWSWSNGATYDVFSNLLTAYDNRPEVAPPPPPVARRGRAPVASRTLSWGPTFPPITEAMEETRAVRDSIAGWWTAPIPVLPAEEYPPMSGTTITSAIFDDPETEF